MKETLCWAGILPTILISATLGSVEVLLKLHSIEFMDFGY